MTKRDKKPEWDGRNEWDPITGTLDGGTIWHDYGRPRRIIVTGPDELPQDVIAREEKRKKRES